MIREALEFLTEQAVDADRPCVAMTPIPGKPGRGVLRTLAVDTEIDILVRWIREVSDVREYGKEPWTLYVEYSRITGELLRSGNVYDRCVMALRQTAAVAAIDALVSQPRSHAEVMRQLRGPLARVWPADHVTALSTLKLVRSEETESDIQKTAAGLSRKAQARVTGASQIETEISIEVSPWSNASLPRVSLPVELMLQFDFDSGKIGFVDIGDTWGTFKERAVAMLADALEKSTDLSECTVVAGTAPARSVATPTGD